MPAYIQALLEQTADSLEGQHDCEGGGFPRGSHASIAPCQTIWVLTGSMRSEQDLLARLAEGGRSCKLPLNVARAQAGMEIQNNTSNIEAILTRLAEQTNAGRTESVQRSTVKSGYWPGPSRTSLKGRCLTMALMKSAGPRHLARLCRRAGHSADGDHLFADDLCDLSALPE